MSLSQDEAEELELLELEELEAASKPQVSALTSALKGAEQGVTFGFADELGGRIAQGVDYAQDLFGESPTEMAARMKAEGVDIGNIPASREELYRQRRGEERKDFAQAQEANPYSYGAGGIGGGLLLNVIPGLGLAKGASLGKAVASGAAQGAAYGAGSTEEEDMSGIAKEAALGALIGGAGGAVGKYAGQALSKAPQVLGKAGNKLRDVAEKYAVKATGATGKQAGEFSDDAGRELLDRGLIKFFDTPENIAGRVGGAVDDAGQEIGKIIKTLDDQGVEASVENIFNGLQSKIDELNATPGNERIVKQLQGELENLVERGQSKLPIGQAEIGKRNFQGQTNYASPEAEKKASAIMARLFKEETEAAATAANPQLGKAFQDEKKLFGMLKPVREAAEKRASTLNQSPFGGLGDTAAAAVGSGGGTLMAGAAAAGRRLIAPRLASMMAISTDAIADMARSAPQKLGKFAPIIQQAAERGGQAVAAANFVLQQSNEEYRQLLKELQDEEEQ